MWASRCWYGLRQRQRRLQQAQKTAPKIHAVAPQVDHDLPELDLMVLHQVRRLLQHCAQEWPSYGLPGKVQKPNRRTLSGRSFRPAHNQNDSILICMNLSVSHFLTNQKARLREHWLKHSLVTGI